VYPKRRPLARPRSSVRGRFSCAEPAGYRKAYVLWARWSRSAASAWPRRSTASCCARPGFSVAVWASSHRAIPEASVTGPVMVIGVGRYLGAQVAARLAADPRVDHVIGLDAVDPPARLAAALAGVELVRADLTSGAGAVTALGPEVVVHLGVLTSPEGASGDRAAMKEHNVIGTMKLLGACQRMPGLRKLVVRSSTAAYGASFRDPA